MHEVTIAGNLQQMLLDVDAVGTDLEWRSSTASPTRLNAAMCERSCIVSRSSMSQTERKSS